MKLRCGGGLVTAYFCPCCCGAASSWMPSFPGRFPSYVLRCPFPSHLFPVPCQVRYQGAPGSR